MSGHGRSDAAQTGGPLAAMSDEELVALLKGLSNGIVSELLQRGHRIDFSVDPARIGRPYPDGPLGVAISSRVVDIHPFMRRH